MKVSLFLIFSLITSFVAAVPLVSPSSEIFDIGSLFDEMIEVGMYSDESLNLFDYLDSNIDELQDLLGAESYSLGKRGESSVASILRLVNSSGVIWELLDQVAGHPTRIEWLANATAHLISSIGGGSIDISLLASLASGLNGSEVFDIVKDSGLVTSILDGILLDDDYRPVLVKLIERIVYSAEPLLKYLITVVLQKRDLEKRADNSGSLETFVGNILSSVLSSSLFTDILNETVVALNDTGFVVYVVKHFIADESYQNMTAALLTDIYKTGVIDVGKVTSSLNVTSIVGTALDDPTKIASLVGGLLSGNVDLSGLGKYADAVKQIIKDLENDGLFARLNTDLFSKKATSTSKAASSSSTNGNNKKVASADSSSSSASATASSSSKSDSGSSNLYERASSPFAKGMLFFQSLIFGGALLMF